MVELFIVAVLIAYYVDFKNNRKNYGDKGQSVLYITVMQAVLLIILKWIFY